MTEAPRQYVLAWPHRPALGRGDFLISASNQAALNLLEGEWPMRRLALVGPAASGKSHLARVWAHETGARVLVPGRLSVLPPADSAVIVEDFDRFGAGEPQAEEWLFHLHNYLSNAGRLLLTGREPPARWPIRLPDLRSRLSALPVARIHPPDDALLRAMLAKLFADRQLRVEDRVLDYLAARVERNFDALERLVSQLDALSLAEQRPVTIQMARPVVERDLC